MSLNTFGDWIALESEMSHTQYHPIPSSASLCLSISVHCGLFELSKLHMSSVLLFLKVYDTVDVLILVGELPTLHCTEYKSMFPLCYPVFSHCVQPFSLIRQQVSEVKKTSSLSRSS